LNAPKVMYLISSMCAAVVGQQQLGVQPFLYIHPEI